MTILGPNGQPYQYKKDKAPHKGPAYGLWSEQADFTGMLPGSATLTFDLSRLTMADFRAMRYHPQVNASLSGLTFMMHQIDWHIECKDKKIADKVERNLREVWTRLIRGMSQSFWAGFSPNALEYENSTDKDELDIVLKRVKDLTPETCEVHWKSVEGAPTAQGHSPKFKYYDGIDQWGTPRIPVENTLWYPLLMENGNYKGRQLLKAVFTPWYFSTIIHLFANRYYERFGEPTPIGRAPYDETMELQDGSEINGKAVMDMILGTLKNRGAVNLPSNRDPVTKEFDYTLEFLESQMRGADFERYLTRLDEEISLGLFTPLLLMKSGDIGSNSLGVQHTQCVSPDTKILCDDLVWRRAGDLEPGQGLVSFDEDVNKGPGYYRTGYVVGNIPSEKLSKTVHTDIGESVTASVDHPWLVWRRRNRRIDGNSNFGLTWVETQDLQEGDKLAFFANPWEVEDSREAGWLAGMFDGEGSITPHIPTEGKGGAGVELTIHQTDGTAYDRIKQDLAERGIDFSHRLRLPGDDFNFSTKGVNTLRIGGGIRGAMELLGKIRPERLIENGGKFWEEVRLMNNRTYSLATVTKIEDAGVHPVASIQVSNGTFITGGYLTHNTWLWMLNAIAGDMAEYLTILTERLKAINFSPKAPTCKWVPNKLGKENNQTTRALLTELVRKDKVKVDLEELGKITGLNLKEVKQLTAAPAGTPGQESPVDDRQRTERPRGEDDPQTVDDPRTRGRDLNG